MMKQITSAAGTVQVKLGPGRVYSAVGVATGTSYTFQLKDGPDSAGNVQIIMGQNGAIPVVAGTQYMSPTWPITFRDGLQVVVTGTPGELDIEFD